ncbi:MAG: hypothetical protein C0605_09370 [Hyphomicrobiales bacterium]|nr:MAG: hypothetical protein C0605_09370 [Hyphomicrobiales bacterium]
MGMKMNHRQADGQASPVQYQDPDFSVWELVREIWARKWIVVVTMLVICSGVLALLMITTPRFSSHVQMLIENRETSFTKPEREVTRNITDTALVANQLQVLRTDQMARTIIKEFKLEDSEEFNPSKRSFIDDMKALAGLKSKDSKLSTSEKVLQVFNRRLAIYQQGTSRVITISFTSEDAELAARIVNRIAELYMQGQSMAKTDNTRQASAWLKSQIETLRGKVLKSEASVEEYRALHGLVKGQPNVTVDSQQLSEINSQLVRARAARSEVQARARLIRRMLSREGGVSAASDVLRSPLIQRLREQQVRQRRQIAELSATLLPGHPRMQQLNADLRNLNRQVDAETRKIVKGLENEARVSAAREAELSRNFKNLQKKVAVNSKAGVELRALEREAKANRDLLESFLKKYQEASARNEVSSQPANARIISNATVSAIPSYPKKTQIMLLAVFGSFILGVSIAAFRAMSSLGRHGSMGAERREPYPAEPASADAFGQLAPALHGMPHMQPRSGGASGPATLEHDDSGLPVWARLTEPSETQLARSMYMQQILNLFQSVQHNSRTRRPTRLLLAAVQGGEGEMRVAADLARVVAENRMRAVLIDADMANPEMSTEYDALSHAGLADCLEGQQVLSQCVVSNIESGIDLVPAGHSRIAPQKLMTAERLNAVLNALAQDYDILIIKAAPPSACPETGQLAALSDIVLLAALTGHTSRAQAEQALWHISGKAAGSVSPGLIITGVSEPDFLGTGPTVMRSDAWPPANSHDGPHPGGGSRAA